MRYYMTVEGPQVYVPEGEAEARLVRHVLMDTLGTCCESLGIWGHPDAREGPWFRASASLPLPALDCKVLILRLALPVDFSDQWPYVCRLCEDTEREPLEALCAATGGSDVIAQEIPSRIQRLYNDLGYTRWLGRQPHMYLRRYADDLVGGVPNG